MITRFNVVWMVFLGVIFQTVAHAAEPIFKIQLSQSSTGFPSTLGLYDVPVEHTFTITNQSTVDMPAMLHILPPHLTKNAAKSTCGSVLGRKSTCQLVTTFVPNRLGHFQGQIKVCGGNGSWCSIYPNALDVTVTQQDIVSTSCSQIKSRPFSDLTCEGSQQFASNFKDFIAQVLQTQPTHHSFRYFQHTPRQDETTTPCLEARQLNVGLDPNIQGGGTPLCQLVGYAMSNADPNGGQPTPGLSKQFPPYLTRLIGTSFPITSNTTPLDNLNALLQDFNTSAMNDSVRNVGYTGYVDFLTNVYQQQLSKDYGACGISITCPSIFYLPYQLGSGQAQLEQWPPAMAYWGSSGGGGGGAGYEIRAFRPGSATHYTLFLGGGGGGAGSTTPEGVGSGITSLINTGSGGGGGNQFGDCYLNAGDNLNGLGLGAGTGSGLSTPEGLDVLFKIAPAVDFSFLKPASHLSWDNATVLTNYGDNLTRLFEALIPQLFLEGYTIAVTGGGGGGGGTEFLSSSGREFTPHPVSIGSGFNFCYLFNKNGDYHQHDCISSPTANTARLSLNNIIYQNLGKLFDEGMRLAILPENCDGYPNYPCTCNFQHTYVITQLSSILKLYGFSNKDIPIWLINAHCGDSEAALLLRASRMDKAQQNHSNPSHYKRSLRAFYQANNQATCVPPWDA
jgi:hypothetical protein